MAKKTAVVRRKIKRSAPVARRKSGGVRRRKGMLGDMFNPTVATNSAKSIVAAAGGGAAAAPFQRILPTKWGTGARLMAAVATGFIAHSVLQSPNLASGFIGGNIALITSKEVYGMNEDGNANFVDNSALRDAPLFMDEDGNALFMDEDGNYHPLTEEQMSELAEDVEFIEV